MPDTDVCEVRRILIAVLKLALLATHDHCRFEQRVECTVLCLVVLRSWAGRNMTNRVQVNTAGHGRHHSPLLQSPFTPIFTHAMHKNAARCTTLCAVLVLLVLCHSPELSTTLVRL